MKHVNAALPSGEAKLTMDLLPFSIGRAILLLGCMAFATMIVIGEEHFLVDSQRIAGQLRVAVIPLAAVWAVLALWETAVWIGSIRRGFRLSESVFSRLTEFAGNSASFNLFYRLDGYFVLAATCLLLQVWMMWFSDWGWRELLISVAVISAICFLRSARPPCVLLLGASRPEVLRLHAIVSRTIRPFRAVSLLDYHKTPVGVSRFLPLRDCLRTVNSDEWRKTVHDLSDMSLIVVMDPRELTQFVHEELLWMLAPERVHKLVFVHYSSSSRSFQWHSLREQFGAQLNEVPVVDEELLQRVLRRCFVRRGGPPTTENPLRDIIESLAAGSPTIGDPT